MSRRIALSILLTVWLAIIAGGISSWLAARSILLSELDASIRRRAMTLPEVTSRGAGPAVIPGDRVVVRDENKTLDRVLASRGSLPEPHVEAADFISLAEGRFRRLTLQFDSVDGGAPLVIVYSAAADGYDSVLTRLAIAVSALGVLAGAVAALASARLARLALRPLQATADAIGAIDEATLDRRIEEGALPPELRPMAGRLNELLQRLHDAFEQRRRFLADASHELRTPVAAMITTIEVALRWPRDSAELTATLSTCLDEARHLHALVQALLRQVRAQEQAGDDEAARRLDAAEVASQCADLSQAMAADRHVRLTRSIQTGIAVKADPARLRSVLLNLVGNAIEHNHAGGSVEIATRADNGSVEIAVTDTGPGIPAEHLPHVFQPFYRASADRETDGHLGLGLFLVESHVKAMGGECRVESTVGVGTTFRVRLPAATNKPKGEERNV